MTAGFSMSTTATVARTEAFDYWRHLISDTFVPLTAEPTGPWNCHGSIGHTPLVGLDLSTVRAGGQRVRRTPGLIARSSHDVLLASIQTAGRGRIEQDGRAADLLPGDMAFYDSTRPYTLHFDDSFAQVVVQLPLADAVALSGVRHLERTTARTVSATGTSGAVAAFFRSLTGSRDGDPSGAQRLAPAAAMLLASALAQLDDAAAPADDGCELRRARAVEVMRRRLHDATLTPDTLAAELHVSRRTLYRTFAEHTGGADGADGVVGLLRRMRVERACHLLRTRPSLSVAAVAAQCGFTGESQFHRAFRALTTTTPAAYRVGDGTPR